MIVCVSPQISAAWRGMGKLPSHWSSVLKHFTTNGRLIWPFQTYLISFHTCFLSVIYWNGCCGVYSGKSDRVYLSVSFPYIGEISLWGLMKWNLNGVPPSSSVWREVMLREASVSILRAFVLNLYSCIWLIRMCGASPLEEGSAEFMSASRDSCVVGPGPGQSVVMAGGYPKPSSLAKWLSFTNNG